MSLLQQFEPKVRSSTGVNLKSIIGSSYPEKAASTGIMTRIVEETPKIITTMVEWTRTRGSKKILQAFILIAMFVSLSLFASQTVVHIAIIVSLCKFVKSILGNTLDIHVKISLLTLRICKSHFHLIVTYVLQCVPYTSSI